MSTPNKKVPTLTDLERNRVPQVRPEVYGTHDDEQGQKARPSRRKKLFGIRLTPQQREMLEDAAQRHGVDMSTVVAIALDAFFTMSREQSSQAKSRWLQRQEGDPEPKGT